MKSQIKIVLFIIFSWAYLTPLSAQDRFELSLVSKAKSKEEGVFSPLPPFWYSFPVSLTWRKGGIHQVSTDAVVLVSNEGFPFGLNVLLKESSFKI